MNIIDELLSEVTPHEQQRVRDRMMLAARIADALNAKGWNQKRLAEELGKKPSEISKWLSGTHNFTIDTLSDLSQILDVKLLCVKEEPAIEARPVIHYQPILITTGKTPATYAPVSWGSFQNSLTQIQPNG